MKYLGPRVKKVRQLGLKPLPGFTNKSVKKFRTPGQHGKTRKELLRKLKRKRYALRLLEKQKLRFNYNISERQLVGYVKKAKKLNGPTGKILLSLLEMRLDNIVYRLGMAPTILAARQLISHGHILVNKKKIDIARYSCNRKDVISVKLKESSLKLVKNFIEKHKHKKIPSHLHFNKEYLVGVVKNKSHRKSINFIIKELLVIEYYARII